VITGRTPYAGISSSGCAPYTTFLEWVEIAPPPNLPPSVALLANDAWLGNNRQSPFQVRLIANQSRLTTKALSQSTSAVAFARAYSVGSDSRKRETSWQVAGSS